MCNSLIMMTTTTASSVLAGGVVPLTTIQRGAGQAIRGGSNSVIFNRTGYYKVNASVTFTAPAAGTITIKAQKNGIDVPGITASTTITTATTEVRTVNVSGIVKVCCCDLPATLTLVNSGVAITTSNVEIDVEYIG